MPKWDRENVIYPCKRMGTYPQIFIKRTMHGEYKGLSISFYETEGGVGITVSMTTRLARILVKKIEQAIKGYVPCR